MPHHYTCSLENCVTEIMCCLYRLPCAVLGDDNRACLVNGNTVERPGTALEVGVAGGLNGDLARTSAKINVYNTCWGSCA